MLEAMNDYAGTVGDISFYRIEVIIPFLVLSMQIQLIYFQFKHSFISMNICCHFPASMSTKHTQSSSVITATDWILTNIILLRRLISWQYLKHMHLL